MIKKLSALVLTGAISFGIVSPALAHDVKSGDTMNKIAESNNMSLKELASLNPQVKNLNLIYVGQNIKTNQNNGQSSEVVKAPTEAVKVSSNASSYERDLLARLVRAEAESEPYAGKVAVAWVVLNRVESSQFPNSIKEVIYQSGQFSPVSNGAINQKADSESIRAVNEALNSDRSQGRGSLFFWNPDTASNRWLESKTTTLVIGNHEFKK